MVSGKPLEPHLIPLSVVGVGELPLDELNLVEGDTGRERPADKAYLGIRRAILTGALKSGEHLREEPLAQMTGTSRTPVRDALGRLVAEGLAVQVNRHRFVADFSFGEITVVFGLRARIEGYAASLAAQRITQSEIEKLAEIINRIDQLAGLDPEAAAERFLKLNAEFHAVIVRATRSSQLQALVAQTVAVPLTTIKKFVWDQKLNIARSNAQHRDILEALTQRDSDWAEASMTGHILSTRPKSPPLNRQDPEGRRSPRA
jgi:DNA-binding GntR family transcriptional regulator